MSRILQVLEKYVRRVEQIFLIIAVIFTLILMFLDAADMGGRYLFNRPFKGAEEISGILLAAIVLLSLGYAQREKAHVAVDILTSRYEPRTRAIVEMVGLIISLVLFVLIGWQATLIAIGDWKVNKLVDTILIPVAPFELLVPIGALIICTEFIFQIGHLVPVLKKARGG